CSQAVVPADGNPPVSATTVAAPPPPPPPPPAPDRWLLMKSLQGTWEGGLLDSNRLQVSGWTDASGTLSSARGSNLPMGFNYEPNEFLLQQNWVRFERSVVKTGTSE